MKVVPEQHLRWLEELSLMHVDKHRVYVHAGVDPDQPLDAQDAQTPAVEDLLAPQGVEA